VPRRYFYDYATCLFYTDLGGIKKGNMAKTRRRGQADNNRNTGKFTCWSIRGRTRFFVYWSDTDGAKISV